MGCDIWFNGKFVRFEDAKIHVLSHVIHYGTSVFEGIRSYDTQAGHAVFRLSEHMRRLMDSAKIYRMDMPYTQNELEQAVLETLARSQLKGGYIRPVALRGMGSMGVDPLANPVEVFIAVWDWGPYLGADAIEHGIDVQVSSWSRMAPNTTPSMAKAGGNYVNAGLAKMDAILNGYAEGIMLTTQGMVAEGSGENLFVVRDNEIVTAPASLSILPGITRDTVIQLAADCGYRVVERQIPRETLLIADEIFFTGTAAEITPIRSVDKHIIGSGTCGPVTRTIQKAFYEVVERGRDPHGWLTRVPSS